MYQHALSSLEHFDRPLNEPEDLQRHQLLGADASAIMALPRIGRLALKMLAVDQAKRRACTGLVRISRMRAEGFHLPVHA